MEGKEKGKEGETTEGKSRVGNTSSTTEDVPLRMHTELFLESLTRTPSFIPKSFKNNG